MTLSPPLRRGYMSLFQNFNFVDVTVTTDTAGDAYTDGDVIGGMLTFNVPTANGSGIINRLIVVDVENVATGLDLFLYNGTPNTIADDAAFAPSAATLVNIVGKIAVATSDYWTENSLAVAEVNDINNSFQTDTKSNLYGYLVANGGNPDYNASNLVLRLGVVSEG